MKSVSAIETMLFNLGLGAVMLVAAGLSGGDYFRKIIPVSIAIIFAGVVIFVSHTHKGRETERDCDERERMIANKTSRATVVFMAYILMGYWAYEVTRGGTFQIPFTFVIFAFWGSYLAAYLYYKFRY